MKPRIKFHDYPGDIPKRAKIALLEGRPDDAKLIYRRGSPLRGVAEIAQTYNQKAAKRYKKMVSMKERAVLKNRGRKEMEQALRERDEAYRRLMEYVNACRQANRSDGASRNCSRNKPKR